MRDVQNGLGVKNMCDLLKKEMCGPFNTSDFTKKQKMKYVRSEYQIIIGINMSELIS